ncbi:MAG: hypothetical protein JSV68_11950 [Anaerolineaceae bacterium]|nr:MAG: hypothetical protein JSV68_11950 [Anaerolineaceae bacterium]
MIKKILAGGVAAALYQSAIIAAEILGKNPPPARYDAVPRVTFTESRLTPT